MRATRNLSRFSTRSGKQGNFIQTSGIRPGVNLGDGFLGMPEELLGRWLKLRRIPREDVVIATRIALTRPVIGGLATYTELIRQCAADSIRRIGCDYWAVLGTVVLIPLFAVLRSVGALAAIAADAWHVHALPRRLVETSLQATAAIGLGATLYALFPVRLSPAGWLVLGLAAVTVVALFSRKLIYWHYTWQHSVNEVLAGHDHAAGPEGGADREALAHGLESWDMHLRACTVPVRASYAGQSLADLQIPARFGCFVVEVERNDLAIPHPSSDFACFPGDKLLLLGRTSEIEKASAFLESDTIANGHRPDFDRAVLESFLVPKQGPVHQPLGQLQIARRTGVRVLGIARDDARILVPQASEMLRPGDRLLGLGTLDQLREFRSWLGSKPNVA